MVCLILVEVLEISPCFAPVFVGVGGEQDISRPLVLWGVLHGCVERKEGGVGVRSSQRGYPLGLAAR